MDKNKLWKWLLLLFLVIWSFALITPLEKKVKLGLDLKGGSSFIVEVDQEDVARKLIESGQYSSTELIDENELNNEVKEVQQIAVEVIRNRIDVLGTSEPEIYPEGDNRIVVRLPGADSETRSEAKSQISKDAVLSFKLVHIESAQWIDEIVASNILPPGFRIVSQDRNGPIYVRDRSVLGDEQLDRSYFNRLKRLGNKPADFMLMEEGLSDGSTVYRPEYVENRW